MRVVPVKDSQIIKEAMVVPDTKKVEMRLFRRTPSADEYCGKS